MRDVTMFYDDVGTGHPLLLLHGLPLDHRHIANDIEHVFTNRSGWRRLYPDLPGMGKTKATARLTNQDPILELVIDIDVLPIPFAAPALFLTGRQDSWCGYHEAYRLLDNYPRASFVVLDALGTHWQLNRKHFSERSYK